MAVYGKPEDPEMYFKTNWFMKVLRFLNLLEPGRNVVSISKVYFIMNMIAFFTILGYLTVVDREQLVAVMVQGAHTTLALLNYMYRRHTLTVGDKSTDKSSDELA